MAKKWLFMVVILLMFLIFRRNKALSITVDDVECVYEEVGFDGDKVFGNFVVVEQFRFWKSAASGVDFTVSDPHGTALRTIKRSLGDKFEFTAPRKGVYKFCFHNHNSISEVVTFYIHVGHIPKDQEFTKEEHLYRLFVTIAKLKAAMESAVVEQSYLRARDTSHRKTSENTQWRVTAFTLSEYLVLVLTSSMQVYFIRRLFKRSYGYNGI